MRQVDETGERFICLWETFSPVIYLDIAGYPTIGFGHKILRGEKFETPITIERAYEILNKDLDSAEIGVDGYISVDLSDLQFDALVSLTFNIGTFAFRGSTLRSKLNRGEYADVGDEFLKWIYTGGRKSNGLIHRRCAERAMYLEGTA